jgi:hypothetical protein
LARSAEDAWRVINPKQISTRQREGLAAWNRLELNKALKQAAGDPALSQHQFGQVPEHLSGADALAEGKRLFGAAYDRLGKRELKLDLKFLQQMAKVRQQILPDLTPDDALKFEARWNETGSAFLQSKSTSAFRRLENELNDLAKTARNAKNSRLAEAYEGLADGLETLRGRQGLATPRLDLAYAKFRRMLEAAGMQAAMDENIFSPGQLRSSVRRATDVERRALGQGLLQRRIGEVQPVFGDTIPQVGPGTAEKWMWGTLLPSAGGLSLWTGNPLPLAVTGAAFGANKLGYTRPVQKALTGFYPWQLRVPMGLLPSAVGSVANQ